METLESSCVCRLCGKQSGISINIFDKNEDHVKKINAVLPIMVHEMDLLPKHMCHRCSYKLEEFHKFYMDCLKTDANLKSQLSWMRKADVQEKIGVPMVHIENVKIKAEPLDYHIYEMDPVMKGMNYLDSINSVAFPVNGIRSDTIHTSTTAYNTYSRCQCHADKERSKNYKRILRCTSNETNEKGPNEIDNNIAKKNAMSAKKNLFARSATSGHQPGIVSKDLFSNNSSLDMQLENVINNVNSRMTEDCCMKINTESRIKQSSIDGLARNLRPRNVEKKNPLDRIVSSSRPRRKTNASREAKSDSGMIAPITNLKTDSNSSNANTKLKISEIKPAINTAVTEMIVLNSRSIETRSHAVETGPIVSSRTKCSSNTEIKSMKSISPSKTDINSRHAGTQNITKIMSKSMETKPVVFSKTKSNSIPQIKIEKPDNTEGRFLRPRLKVIDYLDKRRKRTTLKQSCTDTHEKLAIEKNIEDSEIKKEILDPEDTPSDVSILTTTRLQETCSRSILDDPMEERTDTLPNDILLTIKTEPDAVQPKDDFELIIRSKSPIEITKNRLKNRNKAVCYSPKCLRSQDARLRSGRVKKFDSMQNAARRIRRNLNHMNFRDRNGLKKLPPLVKDSSFSRKLSLPVKSLDNIKHHCEECNVTFVSRELFKLHVCYNT